MKLIMLPGLDGTGELFEPIVALLPSEVDVQVIRFPWNKCMDYESLTSYVMMNLPDERFVLLAESFSGPIAYQIASIKPANLQSVIFVATFLESPRRLMLRLSEFLPRKLLLSSTIPKVLCKAFILGNACNEMLEKFQNIIRLMSTEVLDFRLREMAKLQLRVKPIHIKALYINASKDMLVPKRYIKKFKQAFKEINVLEVEGPHFILQANPGVCSKIIANEINL
jgi:pimeloyl-ACP methyl ester carboxylesterase